MKPHPWRYMGGILATFAVLGLLSYLWPPFYDAFVGPYLWEPILYDQGFNFVNTVAFLLFLAAAVAWFFGLFVQYDLKLDVPTEVAALAWIAWGASLRVMEDADLFAPFANELALQGLPAQTSCAPGLTDAFLTSCAGALFITPIVWIWPALLLFVAGRSALSVQRVDARHGRRAGLVAYGLLHVVFLGLFLVVRAGPQWIRFWPPVWLWILSAAAAVGFVAWRRGAEGHLRWSWALLASAFPLLAASGHAVSVWFGPGAGDWHAGPQATPIAMWLFLLGPAAVAGAVWWHGRTLARGRGREGAAMGWMTYVVLIEAAAILAALVALVRGESWWWIAPLTVAAGHWALRSAVSRGIGHPGMAALAAPIPLMMVWGQSVDALVTAIGIDVYHAGEKHVLAAGLIAAVDGFGLPDPLGQHPAGIVMIVYKLGLTLAAAWYFETRTLQAFHPNLVRVLQLMIVNVGFAPGFRNVLRLTMGV